MVLSKLTIEQRAKLRHRPPLTAQQIRVLELLVKDETRSVQDRVMSGFCRMLLYGRLRFSDGQRITGMKLEALHVDGKMVEFLECSAERTKTMQLYIGSQSQVSSDCSPA